MPKKGGKKAGKEAGDEGKPKGELDGVSKEDLIAMVSQLRMEKRGAEQQVSQLAAALHRQESLSQELESAVSALQQAHERELGLMYDESAISRAELEFRATTTELESQRLKDEITSYIVMQEQNVALKESLAEMHDKLRDANILHRAEVDRLRESVLEHKNKLHKEFKVRLQEMSGAIAEDKMTGALPASMRGETKHVAVNKRSEESASHMSVLMHKHETLEKEHARMRLEHGLAQQSMEIQTREMLQLKRDLLESRERCGGLEQDLRGAQMERELVHSAAKNTEKFEAEIAALKNDVQLMRVKLTASMHAEAMWKKKVSRGMSVSASRPHSSVGHTRGTPSLPTVNGTRRSLSSSSRDNNMSTDFMDMRKIYPKEMPISYGGGVDVKKIWNARTESSGMGDTGGQRGSLTLGAERSSELVGHGHGVRASTAPGVRAELSQTSSNGQYAQLHLPSGGGMLAPDYGIPADGRRSAPPRLNKSEKRPSTGQRFFNPAS